MRGGVRHPPGHAGRADAAAFARERDEELVVAGLATHAREAVGEDATAQVLGKLAIDVARQTTAVGVAQLCKQGLRVA